MVTVSIIYLPAHLASWVLSAVQLNPTRRPLTFYLLTIISTSIQFRNRPKLPKSDASQISPTTRAPSAKTQRPRTARRFRSPAPHLLA